MRESSGELARRPGPLRRFAIVFAGIAAGAAALAACLVLLRTPWDMISFYEMFALAGGLIVGLPIALVVPSRFLSRLSSPLIVLAGALLGPVSLIMVFVVIYAIQGRLREFSLAHLGMGWPLSILVSTVAFAVNVVLSRRYETGAGRVVR